MGTRNNERLVEALLQDGGVMTLADLAASAALTRLEAAETVDRLVAQGRATLNASAQTYSATFVSRDAEQVDVSDAALDLLEPGMTPERWRHALEDHGYYLDAGEMRRIVEDLEGGEMVRPVYEDPACVEERYAEDPDAFGDEDPPAYEAVGM